MLQLLKLQEKVRANASYSCFVMRLGQGFRLWLQSLVAVGHYRLMQFAIRNLCGCGCGMCCDSQFKAFSCILHTPSKLQYFKCSRVWGLQFELTLVVTSYWLFGWEMLLVEWLGVCGGLLIGPLLVLDSGDSDPSYQSIGYNYTKGFFFFAHK